MMGADTCARPGRPPRSESASRVTTVRFSYTERVRIAQAARLNFTTPSDFIRSAALLAVDDTIEVDSLSESSLPSKAVS